MPLESTQTPAHIQIRGARTHNLKSINLDLPRDKLIVITGPSGSGKSSLAFDTIYAEGQRRYVESLSAYARQFLSVMEKPDVDQISGLSPAISIEQKTTSHNPRSTVGTITEIYDYLRVLFARVGLPRCPDHDTVLEAQTITQMVDSLLALPQDSKIMLMAPIVRNRKGEHQQLLLGLKTKGYIRVRINGELYEIDQAPELSLHRKHTIEVVVDRIKIRPDIAQRLADSLATALELSEGMATIVMLESKQPDLLFSANHACPDCGYNLPTLEPRMFSFNNPAGACSECDGLGVNQYFDPDRIISNAELSLAQGAIPGWDRRNFYYYQLLEALSKQFGFSLEQPVNTLSEQEMNLLLFGSGEKEVLFEYLSPSGKKKRKRLPFEGVIHNFQRRYKSTESGTVREHLGRYLNSRICESCAGSRLRIESRHVFVEDKNLTEISALSITQAYEFFSQLTLQGSRAQIAEKLLREIVERLGFLISVGLDYLSLARSAETLSGGEAQRIRLASQVGAGLVGVMYVLDEPSIGLHHRDNERLLKTLTHLRELGNTVIVIEHDMDTMRHADYLVDIGPGAGVHGGTIVAEGSPTEVANNAKSVTGQYLSGNKEIAIPESRMQATGHIKVIGAKGNNLKSIDVSFPLGVITCVTGVSGSGKSTLVNGTLYKYLAQLLHKARDEPAPCSKILGLEQLDKVISIDQSPIGRTPRSNPATYTGLFTPIRELFAGTQEARARGYKAGRFSFNVKGGRCEACQGDGLVRVEMHFLADIYVPCDRCHSKRYNRETLEILYKGKDIHQVLSMTVEQALGFFAAIPMIYRKLQTLVEIGLGYITLGQNATTLSGGEAQRVKLSRELSKKDTGNTLYILDEPTTGLHFQDIELLLLVLQKLRKQGNTLVIIEHNLDVIKTADWIIDLGPEGGAGGGQIIACGTPEEIARNPNSYTGIALADIHGLVSRQKPVKSATV